MIPCYNEAERIQKELFLQALVNDTNLSFVFVNDGSADDTFDVLNVFRNNQNPDIQSRWHILSYINNKGKSNAVRCGFCYVYNQLNVVESQKYDSFNFAEEFPDVTITGSNPIGCDYVGFWDADLATPLEEVSWFYHFAGNQENDMIIGSRVSRLGANIQRTIFRHYSGRLFATLISDGLGWKVHDTQCGAKLLKPHLIPICMGEPFKTSWLFDVEMLLRMKKVFGNDAQGQILEVPIRTWNDVKGSKIGWNDFLKVPYQIWKVFRSYR